MKKITIKEKMEIAEKLKNNPNFGYKKIAHTFNITVSQARIIKNNMHILTSNDNNLRGENRRIHSSDKYDSFYGELMRKLKDYRKEGFPTDFKDVKTITQSIKDSNEKYTDINITEYFIRTFIRKNNLVSNKIHETVSKVDDDVIDSFLKEYFTIRELIQILIFII